MKATKKVVKNQKYFARAINQSTGRVEEDFDNRGDYFDTPEALRKYMEEMVTEDPSYWGEFEFYVCAVDMKPYTAKVAVSATLIKQGD